MFIEIDLHGYTKQEAKIYLDQTLNSLSSTVYEVRVIHGYSSKVLKHFVQRQYNHKKIKRKVLTMNKGETIFIVK